MLRNYLNVSLRHLWRQKGFTFINLLGLAVGMATCLVILLFVRHEYSYDTFHEQADRIYRLAWYAKSGSPDQARVNMPSAMGPALEGEVPEVLRATRISSLFGETLLEHGELQVYETEAILADDAFFDVFSFDLQRGDPATALLRPFTVVLTRSTARKYFGDSDPLGQTLTLNNSHSLEVTGVVEDVPSNSSLTFEILVSYPTRGALNERQQPSWLGMWDRTYVLLAPGSSAESLPVKLEEVTVSKMGVAFGEQGTEQGQKMAFLAQPLTDVHLRGLPSPGADVRMLYLFSAIGFLVLAIACVNYMNLSTARYAGRAREVGVRKSAGAARFQLIWQFLGESVLISLIAFVLAMALVELFLPTFNSLVGVAIHVDYAGRPLLPLAFMGLAMLIGILAGSYPAFFLSSFKPIEALKGSSVTGPGSLAVFLRRGLVVFQFGVSIVLIVGTLVIQNQLDYVKSKPLGFESEQALVIPTRGKMGQEYAAFKQGLLRLANVQRVTTSSGVPANPSYFGLFVTPEGLDRQSVVSYQVDPDFISTMEMDMVAGRDFGANPAADVSAVLINEEAARAFGWDDPLGKEIAFSDEEMMTVIGVVEDFHYQSLREAVTPMIFYLTDRGSRFITARLATGDMSATLAAIEAEWNRLLPEWPFEYAFLDEEYARLYTAEQRLGRIFGIFSGLALGIACLGLFGLAAFAAEQRTREIGIRKVLGASVGSVVGLLSKDFVKLVAFAFVLAAPVAWFAMNRWLESFAYRIEIGPPVFILAALLAVVIAFSTVAWQAIRAATSDPVRALKAE